MSITKINALFHLIGGQTVTVTMPCNDGQSFDENDFEHLAREWRDATNMWLADGSKWAVAVPDMKNVAMVEFHPA